MKVDRDESVDVGHNEIPEIVQRTLGTKYLDAQNLHGCSEDGVIYGLRGFLLPHYLSLRIGASYSQLPEALKSAHKESVRLHCRNNHTRSKRARKRKRGSTMKKTGNTFESIYSGQESSLQNMSITTQKHSRRKRKKSIDDDVGYDRDDWINYQMMARIIVAPYTSSVIALMNLLQTKREITIPARDMRESDVEENMNESSTKPVKYEVLGSDVRVESRTAAVSTIKNVYQKSNKLDNLVTNTNTVITLSSPKESLEAVVDEVICALVKRSNHFRCYSPCPFNKDEKNGNNAVKSVRKPVYRRRQRKNKTLTFTKGQSVSVSSDENVSNGTSKNSWLLERNILSTGYTLGKSDILESFCTSFSPIFTKREQNPFLRGCPNMAPGIHCIHPNNLTTFARSSGLMKLLHSIVGDELLREILLNSVVLIPAIATDLDKYVSSSEFVSRAAYIFRLGNYFQLCGPPLNVVTRRFEKNHIAGINNNRYGKYSAKTTSAYRMLEDLELKEVIDSETGLVKRPKLGTGSPQVLQISHNNEKGKHKHYVAWNPNKPIPRSKLFYSELYTKHVGLSPRHLLNQSTEEHSTSSQSKKSKRENPGATISKNADVNLLNAMVHLWPNYLLDVNSVDKFLFKNKRRKRWKRLRESGIEMCIKMRRRHKCCDYSRILERCCPLPIKIENVSCDQTSKVDSKTELSRMVMLFTPRHKVSLFLENVLRDAFPKSFWGSKHNFHQVVQTMKVFVNLRRTKVFPTKAIVNGIRVLDMTWLFSQKAQSQGPSKIACNKSQLSLSDYQSTFSLLCNVMRWLYCEFIIPLLRSTFYITDTEFSGQNIVYYRKPLWARIRYLSMEILRKRQYREMSVAKVRKILCSHSIGCPPAPLRLLPKKTGIRAIAMLSKSCVLIDKATHYAAGTDKQTGVPLKSKYTPLPPNKVLRSTFDALKYEYKNTPSIFGAGVLGMTEVFPSYCLFLQTLQRKGSQFAHNAQLVKDVSNYSRCAFNNHIKLYFTSADIKNCYDTMNQEYLFKLLWNTLKEDCYITQNHIILHSRDKRSLHHKWRKNTSPPNQFFNPLSSLSKEFKRSIFVDAVNYSVEKKENMIGLLRDHIFGQVVVASNSRGQYPLLQKSGIPQGSILSSLLCNIYFGSLENNMLDGVFERDSLVIKGSFPVKECNSMIVESPNALHLLVRITDDYLLISTDLDTSIRFLEKLNSGIPSLGVRVNHEKTQVNYHVSFEGGQTDKNSIHLNKSWFPWCGLLINTTTCEISLDYERFCGELAIDNVLVEQSEINKFTLIDTMKSFVKPRCYQKLLFSSCINGLQMIRVNFFVTLLLCAVKTIHFVKAGSSRKSLKHSEVIYNSACDTIHFAFSLISFNLNNSVGKTSKFKLKWKEAFWLGRYAFHSVLKREGIYFRTLSLAFSERRDKVLANREDLLNASNQALNLFPLHIQKKPL